MNDSQKPLNLPWFVILFVMGMLVATILFYVSSEEKIVYQEEQPMLLVMFDSWGENIDDSSEAIFNYFIYNFGNVEAKNVSVKCKISNKNEEILKEEIFNIGNIASSSYEYQESYMKYSSNVLEEYGLCVLVSSDENYINLIDKLEDLE